MSTAAAIRQMLAAGLTIEQALIAVEAMEQHAPTPEPVVVERSVGASALRMRRLRERRHEASQVTDCVTCDVTVTKKESSPTPPKEKTTPLPQEPSVPSSSPAAKASKSQNDRSRILEALGSVLDPDRAESVLAHRLKIRKPMTPRAAELLATKLADSGNPNAAADVMILRGWQGYDVSWNGAAVPPLTVAANHTTAEGGFYAMQDTDEYEAWAKATGKRMADAKGGWRFPSRWPPSWAQKSGEPEPSAGQPALDAFG